MSARILINATINGDAHEFLADQRDSLLEALRDRIGLTGAKEGCNNGNCGACAVILDGRLVNSCCVMAAEVEGAELMTVEGIGDADGGVRSVHETHRTGCFAAEVWLGLLAGAGFEPRVVVERTDEEREPRRLFVAARPVA